MTSAAALKTFFPILAKNIDLEPIFIAKLAHNYVICAPFFACAYIIVIIKHLVYKNKNVAFSQKLNISPSIAYKRRTRNTKFGP